MLLFSQPLDSSHMLREFNTLAPGRQTYTLYTRTCEDIHRYKAMHSFSRASTPTVWALNETPAPPDSADICKSSCTVLLKTRKAALKAALKSYATCICSDKIEVIWMTATFGILHRPSQSIHACALYQSKNNPGYHTQSPVYVVDKAGQQI